LAPAPLRAGFGFDLFWLGSGQLAEGVADDGVLWSQFGFLRCLEAASLWKLVVGLELVARIHLFPPFGGKRGTLGPSGLLSLPQHLLSGAGPAEKVGSPRIIFVFGGSKGGAAKWCQCHVPGCVCVLGGGGVPLSGKPTTTACFPLPCCGAESPHMGFVLGSK